MSPRPDLSQLTKTIRAVNEANGWHIDLSNRLELAVKVALIGREAVEAIEEFQALDQAASDQAWRRAIQTEFADTIIRTLDLAGAMGVRLHDAAFVSTLEDDVTPGVIDFQALVMQRVVMPASKAFEILRDPAPVSELAGKLTPHFTDVIDGSEALSRMFDASTSVWDIVNAKIEKNRGRGYRHGGKAY